MVSANCAVYRFFTAYVVIRTVPQCIYGQTREKKKGQSSGHNVAVSFHCSGESPSFEGMMTSRVVRQGLTGCNARIMFGSMRLSE